jgi:hypothetical protein
MIDDDAGPLISQYREAVTFERCGHMSVIVMISKHCKHTFRCRQVTERFDARRDKSTISARDVVAAKDDQIWSLGHDQVSRRFYVPSRDQLAVVQIRNQADAQAL